MKTHIYTAMIFTTVLGFNSTLSAATVGTLSWDGTSDYITDSASTTTYLQLGLLASLNYTQTLAATSATGAYSNYHIASQTEAYNFFNATAIASEIDDGRTFVSAYTAGGPYTDGDLGNNYNAARDYAFFLSDLDTAYVGLLTLQSQATTHGAVSLKEKQYTFARSDDYSESGSSEQHMSWLLVSNANVISQPSAVPIPATAFMFAPALLGFMGLRRRAKNKAI